jgi:two-component system, cell cycle sensor histidine kinase and response regulator CckA
MNTPLRILCFETAPTDAALIFATLEAGDIPCTTTWVQNLADFESQLSRGCFGLVLLDYVMPAFGGLSALAIVRENWPDLPVIHISSTMGEEFVVESLKSGATDYVLKTRLFRLVPAVHRAMQEVAERNEYRRLEARFIEAQKMELIGQHAAGVAHDFNNILSVIMGYSDMLLMKLSTDDSLRNHAGEILRASKRGAALTLQLLVLCRKQTVHPVVMDLNVVLLDLEKMLERLIHENITLAICPGTHAGNILADPGSIGQVLMNMAANARDAMPDGGRLTIATSRVTLDEYSTHVYPGSLPGDYILLSVSDTGTGMSEQVKAHIFEAFFTTKPVGKGTGLGLANCKTIIQQSGGCMSVFSELGKGATFQILFPCVDQPLELAVQSVPIGPLARGTETLLVVEDDPAVRRFAVEVLQTQGYNVLSAVNGKDGINMARTHQGPPIQLVVTDVIMPLIGGRVMAECLKMTCPEVKVLFTSGYNDDTISNHGVLEADMDFLPKPHTQATLTRKVREMLDA